MNVNCKFIHDRQVSIHKFVRRIRNIVGMTFKKRIRISMGVQTFLAAFFVENGHEISCKQSSTQLGLSASLVFIIEFQGIY